MVSVSIFFYEKFQAISSKNFQRFKTGKLIGMFRLIHC